MKIETIWRVYLFRKYLINMYHEYLNTELDIDAFKRLERRDEQTVVSG